MHGGICRRHVVRAGAVALVLVVGPACSSQAPTGTTVPTFGAATSAAGATAPTVAADGAVPDDCARLIGTSDLGALLGLPLDSVEVRTIVGVAEPSVGRTERVACRYTGTAAAGPRRGRTLLDLNVSAYTDPGAAMKQWRVNSDAESGERRELPIGAASAVLVERPGESLLMVAHGTSNLTFVLPGAGSLPVQRPPGDTLVDLALRVLPAVAPSPSAPPAPVPLPPSRAPGTVS